MPRGPRSDEPATKRTIILVTPREDALHFALAAHHQTSLAELVRDLLERDAQRVARALGVPREDLVRTLKSRAKKRAPRKRA